MLCFGDSRNTSHYINLNIPFPGNPAHLTASFTWGRKFDVRKCPGGREREGEGKAFEQRKKIFKIASIRFPMINLSVFLIIHSAYKVQSFSELCIMLKFNIQLHFDYSTFKNCLMSEKIKAVQLNENISKNALFFLAPGAGTFELKSFQMAGNLTSDLVSGAGNLINSDFKSSIKFLGVTREGC